MSKEKIILSIVAAFLGLLVAGGAFYIYQMTRAIDDPQRPQTLGIQKKVSPTPQSADYLIVDNPKDEEVLNKRVITVSGKTSPGATVIISSESGDDVVQPAAGGDFKLTHTIAEGVNLVRITAVFQNGEEQSITKSVTYTTEDF
jgi:hypothetical protein